jgi:DNA-binding response OmpR family regulator
MNMTIHFGGAFETVLLVENRPVLRNYVKGILEGARFTVIPADNAKQAVRLEAEFPGTIDLLLTDLKLGATSGPSLAKKLQERRPQMQVMMLSGDARGSLLLLFDAGWQYVEKAAVSSAIVSKVEELLRGAAERASGRFKTLKVARKSPGRSLLRAQPAAPRRRKSNRLMRAQG